MSRTWVIVAAALVAALVVVIGSAINNVGHAGALPGATAISAIELDLTDARLIHTQGRDVEHVVSVQLTDGYLIATQASGAVVVIRRDALTRLEDIPPRR